MSTLNIHGINKRYGTLEVLKSVDIELESGEFLVLLGSSGCGKSTLLNIVAGLNAPSGGTIDLDGRSIIGVHPKNRDIAMVFQSYALYPNLSVARNIGFGLEMRRVPMDERRRKVAEVAALLQIENLLDRKPSQLSGGQRQRVAIGRALVRDPKVFLFDEPLSNLDAKLRQEMRAEIKRLHQMLRTTTIYVTHDQIEAMTLATRVAVMRNGVIEQLGTPDEIYNAPATMYVAGFVGSPAMNFLDVTVTGDKLRIDGTDMTLAIPAGYNDQLQAGKNLILGLRPEHLSLSDTPAAPDQINATVDLVEMTGRELVISLSVGPQSLTVILPAGAVCDQGQVVTLKPDTASLCLFDPSTQKAIQLSGPGM